MNQRNHLWQRYQGVSCVAYVHVLPVTVHVQQEVGGADRQRDLVPEAVGKAVGEGLRARLAFEAVVVADLLSHAAALQLKVTAVEENRSEVKDAQGSQGRAIWIQDSYWRTVFFFFYFFQKKKIKNL